MCGRFTLRAKPEDVARAAGAGLGRLDVRPRYNIAPTQPVLAFRAGAAEAVTLRWGLIPSWAKDAAIGSRMINARAETVALKPAFRGPFRRRRCAIAADGFYEWQRTAGAKQPFFLRLVGDRPFAFAGLWDAWQGPEGTIESCTIITTQANPLVQPIHDRMPVILTGDAILRWIATPAAAADGLRALLVPWPAEAMDAYPVSRRVNSPAHDDAACIAPVNAAAGEPPAAAGP
ncbi:MAG: SOS response-associated peptidase [Alphaproteobacteria bacterium]